MSLGWFFLLFIFNFYVLVSEIYKHLFERKPFWWTGLILSIPHIFMVISYIYFSFQSDPSSCGAANFELCIGSSIIFGVVIFPIAIITSLLLIFFFVKKNNKKHPGIGDRIGRA